MTIEERDELAVTYRGLARRAAAARRRREPWLDLEDLESAAWLGVLKGARQWPAGSGDVLCFLATCARNAAANYAESARCHSLGIVPLDREPPAGEAAPPVAWTAAEWDAALADLPPRYRKAVEAAYIRQMAAADMVPEFGPTVAAVHVVLFRARQALAESPAFLRIAKGA